VSPDGPLRQCSRPACAEPAAVTLTYDYRRARVWLDPLSEERDPHGYDLCERHAASLSVPQGWHVSDRRGDPALAYVIAV
jgi:Protein of unknown function (DUF3499)